MVRVEGLFFSFPLLLRIGGGFLLKKNSRMLGGGVEEKSEQDSWNNTV